jgi:hypothetical protein
VVTKARSSEELEKMDMRVLGTWVMLRPNELEYARDERLYEPLGEFQPRRCNRGDNDATKGYGINKKNRRDVVTE